MSYMNHVQGTMLSTNQVGYIIVIAWGQGFMAVNQPSPEGTALGTRLVYCHKSLAPCNNYYIVRTIKSNIKVLGMCQTTVH